MRDALLALNPDVAALLDEIEGLGATITFGPTASDLDVRKAEKMLGFKLPDEYRELVTRVGGITLALERTWYFYGLADALARTREYDAELETGRAFDDGYYPRRFLVLLDEGDFSNLGEGIVYDADLEAMIKTFGHEALDRDEAFAVGYWGLLLDELSDVRDRLADPDDILVAGSARDEARRNPVPLTPELLAATDALYAAFARHAPPRDRSANDLGELAYNGAPDYLRHVPRILELLESVSRYGNPVVVIAQIWKNIDAAGPSVAERAAIDRYVDAFWDWLLRCPPVMDDFNESPVNYLVTFVRHGRSIGPFLETWRQLLGTSTAPAHAAKYLQYHNFDYSAADYGWHDLDAAFAELRAFLRALDAS